MNFKGTAAGVAVLVGLTVREEVNPAPRNEESRGLG